MVSRNKNIVDRKELHEKLGVGINKISKTVATTMGAMGRNVIIDVRAGIVNVKSNVGFGVYDSHVTKDGVTVANSIELADPIENIGANFVKDAANNTAKEAGDGTTTATVISSSLFNSGIVPLTVGEANPIFMKRGMDLALKDVLSVFKTYIKPCNPDYLYKIAKTSANGDETIAKIVFDAVSKTGTQGKVHVERMIENNAEDMVTFANGIEVDSGMVSTMFATDKSLRVVYDNPLILFYKGRINDLIELQYVLDYAHASNRPIIIFSDSVSDDTLRKLIVNHSRNILKVCCVKSVGLGHFKESEMEDLTALMGGKVLNENNTNDLKDIEIVKSAFATCERIEIDTTRTIFHGVSGNGQERAKELQEALVNVMGDVNIERFKLRIARLLNGICTIKVSGNSDKEINERLDRYDDAIQATKSALESGVVIGGGIPLYQISDILKQKATEIENVSMRYGYEIVLKAIQSPAKQIAFNGGIPQHIIDRIPKNYKSTFNVLDGEIIDDAYEFGIIDPAKVTQSALKNAISCVGTLLTSDIGVILSDL